MNALLEAFFKKWYLYALIGISFLIGTGTIFYTTAVAPWAFSDSAVYIWSARNLASGIGLVVQNTVGGYDPMTWFTPLFPVLVSIPVSLGADAVQAARWINAVSFGLLLSLAGYMTWRSGKSIIASIAAVILLLVQPGILKIFSGAISEPLFLVFTLAAIFAAYLAVLSPERKGLWLLGGTLAGLSFLIRYTGIALIGAVLVAAIFPKVALKERIRHFAWAALPSLLPAVIWFIITARVSGSLGGRHFILDQSIFSESSKYFQALWEVIVHWIPYITRGNQIISPLGKFALMVFLFSCSYAFLLIRFCRTTKQEKTGRLLLWSNMWIMFSVIYLVFHLFSYLILIEKPDVDMRLLSPIFLSWVMLLAAFFSLLRITPKVKAVDVLFAFVIISGYLFYFGNETISYSHQMHSEGWGFTSKRWQASQLLSEAAAYDLSMKVYSNDPALILFHHGYFPNLIDLQGIASMEKLNNRTAVYILFYPQAVGIYGEKTEALFESIAADLDVIYQDKDGGIFSSSN